VDIFRKAGSQQAKDILELPLRASCLMSQMFFMRCVPEKFLMGVSALSSGSVAEIYRNMDEKGLIL